MSRDHNRRIADLRQRDGGPLSRLRTRGTPRNRNQAVNWILNEWRSDVDALDGLEFERPDRKPVAAAALFRAAIERGRWSSVARRVLIEQGGNNRQVRQLVLPLIGLALEPRRQLVLDETGLSVKCIQAINAWEQNSTEQTRAAVLAHCLLAYGLELGWFDS